MAELETYRERHAALGSDGPKWLSGLRKQGLQRFSSLGFPTKKVEDWRYTDVSPIRSVSFVPSFEARAPGVTDEELSRLTFGAEEAAELVFVNGRLDAARSSAKGLPEGVLAMSLSRALEEHPALVKEHLGKYARAKRAPFAALNTAFLKDGAFIFVPKGVRLSAPLHLVFVGRTGEQPVECHPRSLVVIGEGAEATLVESWAGFDDPRAFFSNAVAEVVLGPKASLEHHLWHRFGPKGLFVGWTEVHQLKSSAYRSHTYWLGGKLARHDLRVSLDEEEARCELFGLYVVGGEDHVDNHTAIDHRAPHCTSRQLYKGVLSQKGHAVFSGVVYVREGAAKTDASQGNHNLLLSRDAAIDTKPQLEIFNDDVQCSHGSTVGQLDEEALFYLRSRGIPEGEARHLLTNAFAAELFAEVRSDFLRERLEKLASRRLDEVQEAG